MSFVKLDAEILESTLWLDREAREIFITALLLSIPQEFTEPLRQINVRSLEETGFTAPPGWYGFAPVSGPGLIHRAIVELTPGMAALERLGAEEPGSRTPLFGGRRLIRIEGGYAVLNFMAYHDKDHTAAERMQRYRKRQALRNAGSNVTPERRNDTQSEVRGKSEDADHTPPTPSLSETPGKSMLQLRIEAFFHRRPKTPWDGSELRAWAKNKGAIEATPEEDLKLLEWFYSLPQAQTYARKNLATLLNNWNGEIDRAKNHQGQKPPVNIHDPKQYEKF
jgi:hypothetical protein